MNQTIPAILVLGTEAEIRGFQSSPLSVLPATYLVLDQTTVYPEYNTPFQWIFNLTLDSSIYELPEAELILNTIDEYLATDGILFCQSVIHPLQLQYQIFQDLLTPHQMFGLNLLPTFAERKIVEIARFRDADLAIEGILSHFQIPYVFTEDSPGLVAARTVCMIINEAAFLLMEKAATASDIDQAMKLGTNYPYGPIEWSKKIGLASVYGILTSLQLYSGSRIQICPLLAEKAINGMELA